MYKTSHLECNILNIYTLIYFKESNYIFQLCVFRLILDLIVISYELIIIIFILML